MDISHCKVDVGKAVLRDYINATIGSRGLQSRASVESLMRGLGPREIRGPTICWR